jgi:chromate reductase
MKIFAISGSLRAGSSNTTLLHTAQKLAPSGVELVIYPSLGELPHFNPDLDRDPLPKPVRQFRETLAQSDALLISTPEYAHGIPGVLKNALDWLVSDTEFPGKPVGLILGSTGDGSFARAALIEVLSTMSAKVIPEAVVSVAGARVNDPRTQLEKVLKSLSAQSR